jgi:hypothetical protein
MTPLLSDKLIRLLRTGTYSEFKEYVLEQPGCLKEKHFRTRRLPIHYAVRDDEARDEDGEEVIDLRMMVALVGFVDHYRLEKFRFMVTVYPESLMEKDQFGQVPLHTAAA